MAVFKDRRFYFNKCVTFPRNAMVGGDNSLREDLPLRHHRLFFCTCPRQSIWTLWDWYLYVQTFKWLIAENIIVWCICSIAIVALWNRPQERRCMSVCPASRDPNQLLVQVSRLWMLQRSLNKHQEDLLDWSRFFSNIWGTQIWDSFTWTLKQQRLLC